MTKEEAIQIIELAKYKEQKPFIQEHIISADVSNCGYDSSAWFYWNDGYFFKTEKEAQEHINKILSKNKLEDSE